MVEVSTGINRGACWYGIDVFKFIAAILIVFMHTYNSDMGVCGGWIKNVLSVACVPFFFIVSGFLLRGGLDKSYERGGSAGESMWFKRYEIRLIKMYLAWSIITFPVAIMIVNRGHPEYGVAMKVLYLFRLFFLTGSIGIYWYLLALIICAPVIRWCKKKSLSWCLFVVSIALYLWGCVYNSPANDHRPSLEILHIVFGSERNFLNVGFFYMMVGFLIPIKRIDHDALWKILSIILLLVSIALRTWEWQVPGTNYSESLVAVSFLGTAVSFGYSYFSRISLELRKLSIGIYLIHFPFILLFDFYLTKGTLLDFPIALTFSVVVYYLFFAIFPRVSTILFGYGR